MSLKALVEKRNALLDEAKMILDKVETEVRALTTEEDSEYELKIREVEQINATIKKLEERAVEETTEEVVDSAVEEERNMEKADIKDFEIRALDQLIRRKDGEELRTAIKTSTNGELVPTHLYPEVIQKLEEVAPLFSMVPKLTPQAGIIEIPRETGIGTAGFVGEMTDLTANAFTMDKVKLEQRRCGSAMEISQNIMNDAGIDVVSYAKDVLYRRLGYALDRNMINGSKTNDFEGLKLAPEQCNVKIGTNGVITIEDFINLLNALHPTRQTGAVWVMSRELFNAVSLLKDGNGNFYLLRQQNVVTGQPEYRLLNLPIYINDAVDKDFTSASKKVCYLVNFAEAYKGMSKKNMEIKQISGDTVQSLRGSHLLTLDIYADVKIVQPEAIRVLVTK